MALGALVRIQQRVESSASFSRPSADLWTPQLDAGEGLEVPAELPSPREGDRYVTIDEQVEDTTGVVAADWPVVDAFGLQFPGRIDPAWYDTAELVSVIDRFRRQAHQMERPLRIGDTFWVRGFSDSAPEEWADLRDVTSQARAITKAAVAVAVLGSVRPPAEDDALAAEPEVSEPPAAGVQHGPGGVATARPTI